MTDYYPLLARAVSGLEKNTGENRRALYERARNALVGQLRGTQPPLPEADITRERLALEDAVRKIEADEARRLRTPAPAAPSISVPQPGAPPASPRGPVPPPPAGRAAAPVPPNLPPPQPGAPRPAVPRPEDLRRNPPPPGPGQASAPPRPPVPPPGPTPPPGSRSPVPPPRPASPPPRPPEARPGVPPGMQQRPPERRESPPSPAPRAPDGYAPPPERAPRPAEPVSLDSPPVDRSYGAAPRRPADPDYSQPTDLDGDSPPPTDLPMRRRRPPGPAPRRPLDDEDKRANPVRRGLIFATLAVLLVGIVGGGAFWQRDKISSIFNAAKNLAPKSGGGTNQSPQKAGDRLGQDGQPAQGQNAPGALVAQRVVLYEEDPANPEGNRYSGSAIWRTETVSPGPGLAPELAVRADIEIPERKFAMTMSIRRNTDSALPASHTVEIMFTLPADFPSGGVDKVPGLLMKESEQARGAPLSGLAVKVTNGFFLIGLSSAEGDVARNLQLLKERGWFDIPMVYNNNRRAILAVEKGTPGERAFAEAFAAWSK